MIIYVENTKNIPLNLIREIQIKTTKIYHFTYIIRAKIKNTDLIKSWQGCKEVGSLMHCWWVNGPVILEKSPRISNTLKYSLAEFLILQINQ